MRYMVAKSYADMAATLRAASERIIILAGGTDLMVARREQLFEAPVLDISRVPELNTIALSDGTLAIGSAVTYRKIIHNALIQKYCPVLTESAARTGSIQIQNLGTLGGNVVNASPAGDSLTVLVALEAEVEIFWNDRTLIKPISSFILGPGQVDLPDNAVVTRFLIPLHAQSLRSAFYKLGNRAYPQHPMSISVVNAVAVVCVAAEERRIVWARIALGAVAPTPVRAHAAEEKLCGQHISRQLIRQAATEAVQAISPIDDLRATAAYRRAVTPAIVEKVLSAALEPYV
jgi:CO/xanthine dehydrogenase FAD-binding subunit